MKIVCDRTALADAVSLVSGVVAARSPSPVLQCLRLSAGNGQLRLSATDLEIGVAQSIDEVDVQQEGEVLVPADKLSQIVKASDDPTLTLEADGDRLRIRGLGSNWSLHGFPVSEAPEVEDFDESITADYEVPAVILANKSNAPCLPLPTNSLDMPSTAFCSSEADKPSVAWPPMAADWPFRHAHAKTTDQDGNTIVPSKPSNSWANCWIHVPRAVRVSIREGRAHSGSVTVPERHHHDLG